MPTQDAAWTSGNCLVVDSGGNTASWGSCGGVGSGITGLTADSGGSTTGTAVTLAGGTNGIDTSRATDTVTFNLDTTEIGTTTFGAGSGIVWTFDASAGTDPAITFGNGTVNVSTGTLQHAGSAVVDVGDTGTVTGTMIANATIGYADVDATDTLSTAARGANAVWFGTTGLVFEGSNNDGVELLVTAADPTTSDKTITFPNTTGTVVTTGDSGTVTSTMIANSTIAPGDMDLTATYSFSSGGLVLPNNTAATCATIGAIEGTACWATDTDKLYLANGASALILVDTSSNQTLTTKTLTSPTINTPSITTATVSGVTTATYTDSSTSGIPAMSTWTQTMAPGSASTSLNLGNVFQSDYNTTTNSTSALLVGVYGKATASNTGDIGTLAAFYAQVGTTNAGATATNTYGLYVANSSSTGTNTNDWAIYTAGAEDSYFGGPVRFAASTTSTAAPAAGQSTVSTYAPSNWTFPLPSARTPNERVWRALPGVMSGWATSCVLPGKSTSATSVGIPVTSTGTVSHPEPATTSTLTSMNRTVVTSAAGAGSSAEIYGGHRMVWRGNASGLGGFLFYARFATGTAVATQRAFVGVWDESAAIGNVEPNAKTDSIYVGYNASGTTLNVCGNNNAGTAGCVDLGANFPVSATAVYDVWLYAPPNGSRWDYFVERLDSAQTASGTEADATDMPRNTQFLQPTAWVNNGSTASAVELDLMRMCVTSPL